MLIIASQNFRKSFRPGSTVKDGDEDEAGNHNIDISPILSKVQTFKQAIESLDEVKIFFNQCGRYALAPKISSHVSKLATFHAASLK